MPTLEQHKPIEVKNDQCRPNSGFHAELNSIWGPPKRNPVDYTQQFLSGAAQGFGQAATESVQSGVKTISHPAETAQQLLKATVETGRTTIALTSAFGRHATDKISHGDAQGIANDASHVASVLAHSVQTGLDHYSKMSAREQGRIFGHDIAPTVTATIVMPELIPEGAGAAAAAKIASATKTLMKEEGTIAKLATTFDGAKEKIQDISEKLTAMSKKMEQLTQQDKAHLERKYLAGAGGDWTKLNERASTRVVQQCHPNACVAASGEMLTNGVIEQKTLIEKMNKNWGEELLERMAEKRQHPTADIEWLAPELGPEWKAARYDLVVRPNRLDYILNKNSPWGAELKSNEKIAHVVVVDGINESGNLCIRDPQNATEYEVTRKDFIALWSGAVFRD